MPNLLDFPFKRTYSIDLEDPVREFIFFHGGGHPDEFKDDIQQWQDLREKAVEDVVHVDRIHAILLWVLAFPVLPLHADLSFFLSYCSYHTQLTSIFAKMPSDVSHPSRRLLYAVEAPSLDSS